MTPSGRTPHESAEDRLRDVLRSEATTIVPAGDGLSKIQQRVAQRRRRRVVLLPSAALAMAGAVTAFFLLGGSGGTQKLVQTPATHGPTTSSSCGSQQPCPTPTPKATGTTAPVLPVVTYTGPALWPFTSAAQAQAWQSDHGSRPWANNAQQVAQHFANDFLGLQGFKAPGDVEVLLGFNKGVVATAVLKEGGRVVSSLALRQLLGAGGPWTVVAAGGTDLTVTSPASGTGISSPTSVTGRVTGVDENVRLRLITAPGKEIANTGAAAGSAVPWQGTLTWSDSSWTTAGIVGTTYSAKDGALTRLVVVPVHRATGSSASGASFVALAGGHVNLYDSASGKQRKQLTFPPAGRYDTGATWSGSTLAWVRSQQTGCADALYRLENGSITTIVKAGTAHVGTPQLSASGGWLAWLQTPCNGGSASVVVLGGGAPGRTLPMASGASVQVLDVGDDGAVLLLTRQPAGSGAGVLRLVPGGALNLSGARTMTSASGCEWRSGALDGTSVLGGETCDSNSRVVQLDRSGARTRTDPFLPGNGYLATVAVRSGTVLVQTRGTGSAGPIGTYANGQITPVAQKGGCAVSPSTGCLEAPDW